MNQYPICSSNRKTYRPDLPASPRYRLAVLSLALIGLTPLVIASLIQPNPSGLGSHRQLHLPPCGFYEQTGYPCPTCGMTTAFTYLVRGRFFHAFTVQPAGALAALACLIFTTITTYSAFTARRLDNLICWIALHRIHLIIIGLTIFLLSWGWLCFMTWMRPS